MHDDGLPRKTVSPQILAALPLLALIGGNALLAFGPWFVRLADVGPLAAGFWRVAIAAPLLVGLSYVGDGKPLRAARGLAPLLLLCGIAFAADLGAWHLGILRTTLANATLFGNSAILMFPIYGFIAARAWPNRTQGLALALAAAGAALLLGRSYELSAKNLAGDLFCLLSGTLYTIYFVAMARARTVMAPLPALALSSTISILPLLVAALAMGEQVWPERWGVLVGLALASQVAGQGLMIYALGKFPPLVMGIALLSQPVIAGTVGWIVYGERLGAADFIGAVLVAIALVLVRREAPLAPPDEKRRAA